MPQSAPLRTRRLAPAPRPRTTALPPVRAGSGGVFASGAANGRAWCAPDQGTDQARPGKPAVALRMGGEATGGRIAQGPVSPARLAPPNGPQRNWLDLTRPRLSGRLAGGFAGRVSVSSDGT